MSQRRVFCTSIPKSGKNLLYSFYFGLGFRRVEWPDGLDAFHNSFCEEFAGRGTYTAPACHPLSDDSRAVICSNLTRTLRSLPPNAVAHRHFFPHACFTGLFGTGAIGAVFLYRHPRDVLVSMLNYARMQNLPHHVAGLLEGLSDADALLRLLVGGPDLVPFASYFDAYRGWLTDRHVLAIKFENLIGPEGGGNLHDQKHACAQLAALVGIDEFDPRLRAAQNGVFNRTAGTFFRGQIGGWKETFSTSIDRVYEREAGWLDERWGYA